MTGLDVGVPIQGVDVFIYPRAAGPDQCIYMLTNGDVDPTAVALAGVELARSFLSDALAIPSGWENVFYTTATPHIAGHYPDALKGSVDPSGILGNKIWFTDTVLAAKYAVAMKPWAIWTNLVEVNIIYTDELAAVAPVLTSPINKYIVQVNKETGIAYDAILNWTHAVHGFMVPYVYRIQMAYDSAFTALVLNVITPAGAPPLIVGPWAAGVYNIVYQPGEILYWRVRAEGPFFSHWSQTFELDIQAAPIPVPILYFPLNNAIVGTLTPSFSWSPMSGTAIPSGITTTYTLQIGTDPNFPVLSFHEYPVTNTTSFIMPEGVLVNGTTYYWRVCTDVAPHTNWSATFFFKADTSYATTTVTTTSTTTAVPSTVAVPSGSATHTDNVVNPSYIWAIIIIGAVLVIAVIVLIFRTRRV
jgi:hypothetical protein